MNNTKLYLFTAFLSCFLLGGPSMLAQTEFIVDSQNVSSFLTELDDYYGNMITVSEADILSFLDPFLGPDESVDCTLPGAFIQNRSTGNVTFGLDSIDLYRAGRLSLRTASDQEHISFNDDEVDFSLSQGLHLFAFQRKCTITQRSFTHIIILDEVIAIVFVDDNNCDCTPSGNSDNSYDDGMISIENYNNNLLFSIIDNTTSTEVAAIRIQLTEGEQEQNYAINLNCAGSSSATITNNGDIPVIMVNYDFASLLNFNNNGSLGLQFSLAPGYIATTQACRPKNRNRQWQVIPTEPSTYRVQSMDMPPNIPTQWGLYNIAGQLLQHGTSSAGVANLKLNLTNYPSGLYLFRWQNNEDVGTLKILHP